MSARKLLAVIAGVAALATGVAAQQTMQINGAGATFPNPIYSKWFSEYNKLHASVQINYQSLGSGAGIRQITSQTVFFGATDGPMTGDQLLAAPGKILHFPTVLGAVVPVYNIPGVSAELKFTGAVLADIYLGKITKWNDKAIAEVNPGIKLPSTAIAPVHRADGSGTTFVFTDYLSMQSPEWKEKVGASTSVNWPNGAGAKGSDGVAGTVRQIPGGIGYDESAYAEQNHLTTVMLRNHDGKFVAPTMAAFQASAANADWTKVQNFAIDLNDQKGAESWPIESATFVLLPTDPKNEKQSAAVKKFFDWGFAHGSDIATGLLYIPLPASVQDAIRAAWKGVPGTM
jgi:phosphate transport system substrate-binding protein